MAASPAEGRLGGASTVWKACGRRTISWLPAAGLSAARATPALTPAAATRATARDAVRIIGSSCGEGEGTPGKLRGGTARVVARSRDLACPVRVISGSLARVILIAGRGDARGRSSAYVWGMRALRLLFVRTLLQYGDSVLVALLAGSALLDALASGTPILDGLLTALVALPLLLRR